MHANYPPTQDYNNSRLIPIAVNQLLNLYFSNVIHNKINNLKRRTTITTTITRSNLLDRQLDLSDATFSPITRTTSRDDEQACRAAMCQIRANPSIPRSRPSRTMSQPRLWVATGTSTWPRHPNLTRLWSRRRRLLPPSIASRSRNWPNSWASRRCE